jgi:hypothetical protein
VGARAVQATDMRRVLCRGSRVGQLPPRMGAGGAKEVKGMAKKKVAKKTAKKKKVAKKKKK